MVLPVMLMLLTLMTLVAGKIYALAEQRRVLARAEMERGQINHLLLSAEDLIVRKLPLLDVPLFQRLQGQKENAPITFDFPIVQGSVQIVVKSAQRCLNLAPLFENDQKEKNFTLRLFMRLAKQYGLTGGDMLSGGRPQDIALQKSFGELVCWLPGAGQHWDIRYLNEGQLPLIIATLPGENKETVRTWLRRGLSPAEQQKINNRLGYTLLETQSRFWWLEMRFTRDDRQFLAKDLIEIDGRQARILRRRLVDDDAL